MTLTVGQSGARTNVVPDSARLGLDCRVWTKAEADRVEAALRAYESRDPRVSGASDGNLTAAAGVPTLDGLGPVGDGAHARHEWVLASDLPRRAELLARLLDSRG